MKTMALLETENGARYTYLLDDVQTREIELDGDCSLHYSNDFDLEDGGISK